MTKKDSIDPFFIKGTKAFRNKEYDKAIEYYNKCLEIELNNLNVLHLKALALGELKRYEERSACLEKILDILEIIRFNSNWNYFLEKAQTLGELGRFDEAIKCYNELLTGRRGDYKPLQYMIQLLWDLKRYDEVIAVCDKAVRYISDAPYFSRTREDAIKAKEKEKQKEFRI